MLVSSYGIINGFDPYTNDYRNETMPDTDGNTFWIKLRLFVLDYFVIILAVGICLILLGCFCYLRKLEYPEMMMNRSRRNQTLPLAVRSSRKKTRVPYQKGFETKNPPLTDPQVVTVNPVQVPVQPIPESFVQNKPVYIQPTPPPKPVT